MLLLFAACSDASEPEPVAEATAVATAAAEPTVVVDAPPTVAPTVVPTLGDADPATVETVAAGVRVEDPLGNLVAVHGVRRLPTELEGIAAFDLFHNTESVLSAAPVAVLDVSACMTVDDTGLDAVSLGIEAAVDAPLDSDAQPGLGHALVDPVFVWPEAGECGRGWLPVVVEGDPDIARYVATVEGSAHVFQWELDSFDPPATDGASAFGVGETVTFNQGPLEGTTVVLRGWAEQPGAEPPVPGTREVAVLVEVCPATEDWPELGLAIEGWNLLEPHDPGDRLGADPLAPLSGSCFEDWAEFAVPEGLVPSGFFVSDGVDPVNGFATWSLVDAAIDPPA